MFFGGIPQYLANRQKQGRLWDSYKNFGKAVGMSDRDVYASYVQLSAVPFIGDQLKASDAIARMDDYMGNRGIGYGNVKYPTNTVGAGLGSSVSGAVSLSRNVSKLY